MALRVRAAQTETRKGSGLHGPKIWLSELLSSFLRACSLVSSPVRRPYASSSLLGLPPQKMECYKIRGAGWQWGPQ